MKLGDYWLSFSITPVQGFIAASRTVRDLKTGSALLCYLVGQGIETGKSLGGKLLFPAVVPGTHYESIPNQFVMTFVDAAQAAQAQDLIAAAVEASWQALAGKVRRLLGHAWDQTWPGWDVGWEAQIESYWDVRVLVLDAGDAVVSEAYARLFPKRAASALMEQRWSLLAVALNADKQIRHFPGNQGVGRDKCTLFGGWEQMGPGGEVRSQTAFWEQVTGFQRGAIRIGAQDRLCAPALTKRFAPRVISALHSLRAQVDDTAKVAAAAWRTDADSEVAGPALRDFDLAVDALRQALGREAAETRDRYLLDDNLTAEALVKDFPVDERGRDLTRAKSSLMEVIRTRSVLLDQTRAVGLTMPPRYFAVVELDGDQMGKRLSGEYGPISEGFYEQMSSRLRAFASGVPATVGAPDYAGYSVYAGGDDALALLPLSRALACAARLRDEFVNLNLPPVSEPTRASAGLVICHYQYDLREALAAVRGAIDRAKEFGRDACAISLLKRSGGDLHVVLSWELLSDINQLAGRFRGGTSDRWAARLAQIIPSLDPGAVQSAGQMEALLKHFAGHSQAAGFDGADISDLPLTDAVALWRDLCRFLDERHRGLQADRGRQDTAILQQFPANDRPGFFRHALETYMDCIGIASFLARGRE